MIFWISGFFFFMLSLTVEVYLRWKWHISFLCKRETLKNQQCIKYLFAPLYVVIWLRSEPCFLINNLLVIYNSFFTLIAYGNINVMNEDVIFAYHRVILNPCAVTWQKGYILKYLQMVIRFVHFRSSEAIMWEIIDTRNMLKWVWNAKDDRTEMFATLLNCTVLLDCVVYHLVVS